MPIFYLAAFAGGVAATMAWYRVNKTDKMQAELADMYKQAERDGWSYGPPED